MKGKKLKYIVGIVVIIGAFSYLAWATIAGSYKFIITPSEFMAAEQQYAGKVVKLSGVVKPGSISFDEEDLRFTITDTAQEIDVHYIGMTPNNFSEGSEIVASGKFDEDRGVLEATQLITKCASKYEAN